LALGLDAEKRKALDMFEIPDPFREHAQQPRRYGQLSEPKKLQQLLAGRHDPPAAAHWPTSLGMPLPTSIT
jgi:hypothetical protein